MAHLLYSRVSHVPAQIYITPTFKFKKIYIYSIGLWLSDDLGLVLWDYGQITIYCTLHTVWAHVPYGKCLSMPDNISPTYTWQEMRENIKTITCMHVDKHREFDAFTLENDPMPQLCIMKTRLHVYNFEPLKPHFYIVKLGFTGVYIIFLISAQKHRLSVLEAVLTSTHNLCFEQKYEKILEFFTWKFSVFGGEILYIFE